MKYLKLVNSFDEFAEDAKSGVVYYHIDNDVYYWLNLATIWGYIGYNSQNRTFVYNGKNFSIIPEVPDPEDLAGDVTINSSSFGTTVPQTLTFKYSDFSVIPINYFQVSNLNYIVELGGTIPMSIFHYAASNFSILFKGLDYGLLTTFYRQGSSNYSGYLVFDDTTGQIDFGGYVPQDLFYYMLNNGIGIMFRYVGENSDIISDSLFIKNITQEKLNSYYDTYKHDEDLTSSSYYAQCLFMYDCTGFEKIKVCFYTFEGDGDTKYSQLSGYRNVANGVELTLDAAESNGVVPDTIWKRLSKVSGWSYFSDVKYENVTDYGLYYKPYVKTSQYTPLTSELISLGASRAVSIFEENIVDVTPSTNNWASIIANNYDLTGIQNFIYYLNSYPSREKSTITIYGSPITSYDEITVPGFRWAGISSSNRFILATPKISNVNLSCFGAGASGNTVHFINTEDSAVNLGTVVSKGVQFCVYVGNCDIHISGFKISGTSITLSAFKYDNLNSTKAIYLENLDGTVSVNVECSRVYMSGYQGDSQEWIKLAGCTTVENPTPLDYYNANVDTWSTVRNGFAQNVDVQIIRSVFNATSVQASFTLSKLVCLANGGTFVGASCLATSEDMEKLISCVPNRANSGKNFTFSSPQYALLTTSQISYLTGLGYQIIEQQ